MKAWVLHSAGDIRYEEAAQPDIGEREVLVAVKAAGICGSDLPRIYRDGAHKMPLIPGHEFAGEVVRTGKCVNTEWLGERVGVFPLIPCHNCVSCRQKQYEMCSDYSYLGSRQDGGFTEYVAVPEKNLIKLPGNVTYEEGAMLEPVSVAVHAVKQINPAVDGSIAVLGLGTIGMLAVMALLEEGCRNILVLGNKEFQKETIQKLGLKPEQYCDVRKQNVKKWISDRTSGRGVSAVFECVGKHTTIVQAIGLAEPGGRICMVGNPDADVILKKEIYWKILRNQLTLKGTWNSSFTGEETDDWHTALKILSEKKCTPEKIITHRLPLDELEKGLEIMRLKTEDYGKIMIFPA